MASLYPEIEPFHHFYLQVDEQHQIYVEQCGNPNSSPVLFIHGGPGAGCSARDRRFFNPDKFNIILFDQRGCGRSKPFGSLENNTTQHLLSDIEKIRTTLNIEKWHVFGGSWGSTLSLVYAQSHAEQVLSLTLRGIFLARAEDWDFAFNGKGTHRIFPDVYEKLVAPVAEHKRDNFIQEAYNLLTGEDQNKAKQMANAWAHWEEYCCTLKPKQSYQENEDTYWTIARHECFYLVNNCFLTDNQILNNAAKIQHIPCTIIHGRWDVVAPFDNAWLLHKALPQSKLHIIDDAGHASSEPNITTALIKATDDLLTNLNSG